LGGIRKGGPPQKCEPVELEKEVHLKRRSSSKGKGIKKEVLLKRVLLANKGDLTSCNPHPLIPAL
jgi:hypothetical protein